VGQIAITVAGGTTVGTTATVDRYGTLQAATALTSAGQVITPGASLVPIVKTFGGDASVWPLTLNGLLGSHGGQPVLAQGFCYNTTGAPTIADDTLQVALSGHGPFSGSLSGLLPLTTYHIRAFATNAVGTGYGPEITVTTPAFSCGHARWAFDNYAYATVQIGGQCWFAENLRTTTYSDGSSIPSGLIDGPWSSTTTGARSYYAEGTADETAEVETNGRLYNFWAVQTGLLCPVGWHVPLATEWNTMMAEVVNAVDLKATAPDWDGTNASGFSALPSGWRHPSGGYQNQNSHTAWWTATEGSATTAIDRVLTGTALSGYVPLKNYGLSVRCVQ